MGVVEGGCSGLPHVKIFFSSSLMHNAYKTSTGLHWGKNVLFQVLIIPIYLFIFVPAETVALGEVAH